MKSSFFIAIDPPRVTAQQKGVRDVNGKPMFYEKAKVKAAREILALHLRKYRPKHPMQGAVRLLCVWRFRGKKVGWKTTRPDTDNLQKLLKDVMTELGFWKDDAQVVIDIAEKMWHPKPGIYIEVEEIDDGVEAGHAQGHPSIPSTQEG